MTDLSHDAPDDGFHEIQLSGKQLVFLFMATTVVSVVIFLCGVLVGRGVRGEPVSADGAAPPISTGGPSAVGESAGAAAADRRRRRAREHRLELYRAARRRTSRSTRSSRAVGQRRRATPLRAGAADTAAGRGPGCSEGGAQPRRRRRDNGCRPAAADAAKPKAGVWAVQVVALTDRAAAIGGRPAAEQQGLSGVPRAAAVRRRGADYKVQVGRFEDRAEAEQVVAGRLKKEEQFQPWILR